MVGEIPTTCHRQKHQDQGDPFGNYKATGAGFCPINHHYSRGVVVLSCQYWILVGKKTSNLAPDFTWRLRLLGWCLSLDHGECYPKIHPIPSTRIFRTISREIPGISQGRGILPSTIVQDYSRYSRDDLNETQALFIEVTSKTSNSNWPFASEKLSLPPKNASIKSISINFGYFCGGKVSTTKPPPPQKKLVISCYQGHAFRIHFQLLKPWMVGASIRSTFRWWI